MKKCILWILLILVSSCNLKTKHVENIEPNKVKDNLTHGDHDGNKWEQELYENFIKDNTSKEEPMDTIEFVTYWAQFQKAIVLKDMKLLLSLTNDKILLGGIDKNFLPIWENLSDVETPLNSYVEIISKDKFWGNMDEVFIPQFKNLLKRYNIKKDLSKQEYFCLDRIQDKQIFIYTDFDNPINGVLFRMDYSNIGGRSSTGIELVFYKNKEKEIKLFVIASYTMSVSE